MQDSETEQSQVCLHLAAFCDVHIMPFPAKPLGQFGVASKHEIPFVGLVWTAELVARPVDQVDVVGNVGRRADEFIDQALPEKIEH